MSEILVKTYTRHRDIESKHYLRDWTAGDVIGCYPDGTLIGKDGNLKHTTMYYMNMVFKVDASLPQFYAGEFTKDQDGKLSSRSDLIIDLADVLTDQQLKDAMDHGIMNPIRDLKISYLDLLVSRTERTALNVHDKQGSVAQGEYYIKSGGSSPDYASMSVFESDIAATLTGNLTGNADEAFNDSTPVLVDGIEDDGFTLTFKSSGTGANNSAKWDTAKYYISRNSSAPTFDINDTNCDNVVLDQLQITNDGSGRVLWCDVAINLDISNCFFKVASGSACLVYAPTVRVWNSIFWGGGTSEGLKLGTSGSVNMYNCTVYNFDDGLERDAGTFNVYNTACFGNTDDFDGTFGTIDYCASDDNDGTNNVAESGGGAAWPNDFTDAANGDFTLLAGSNLVGGGTDDPGSGLYSDDIAGTARSSTWDVGAYEYAVAGRTTKNTDAWHHGQNYGQSFGVVTT